MNGVWTGMIPSKRGIGWGEEGIGTSAINTIFPPAPALRQEFRAGWDGTGFRAVLVMADFAPPSSSTAEKQDLLPTSADNQRKLAESVLSKDGSVILWHDSNSLQVERIEKLPPDPISLRHVDQVTGGFTDEDAALMKSCRELASLRIHRGSMTRLPLESLPDLKRFEISECRITLAGVRGLTGKQNLHQVLIGSTPVGGEIFNLLTTCPKLAISPSPRLA